MVTQRIECALAPLLSGRWRNTPGAAVRQGKDARLLPESPRQAGVVGVGRAAGSRYPGDIRRRCSRGRRGERQCAMAREGAGVEGLRRLPRVVHLSIVLQGI